MQAIPVNASGERTITVNVGPESFRFRTYFVSGESDHWLLDISDIQDRPLITGISLNPGPDNLLKGRGDTLEGYQLFAAVRPGTTGQELEAPGDSLYLIWLNPGESNPLDPGDPMDNVGVGAWQ